MDIFTVSDYIDLSEKAERAWEDHSDCATLFESGRATYEQLATTLLAAQTANRAVDIARIYRDRKHYPDDIRDMVTDLAEAVFDGNDIDQEEYRVLVESVRHFQRNPERWDDELSYDSSLGVL